VASRLDWTGLAVANRLFDRFACEGTSGHKRSLKLCQPSSLFQSVPREIGDGQSRIPALRREDCDRKGESFYGFTLNGDEVCCREAYENAEGVVAHLDNVGALLAEMLTMADLTPLEVHGQAAELEKLKKPLARLNPTWFALEASLPQ
jgi:hypothetical protein